MAEAGKDSSVFDLPSANVTPINRSNREGGGMDFIEIIFHIAPDGGSGALEATILVGFCAIVLAAMVGRRRRIAGRLYPSHHA